MVLVHDRQHELGRMITEERAALDYRINELDGPAAVIASGMGKRAHQVAFPERLVVIMVFRLVPGNRAVDKQRRSLANAQHGCARIAVGAVLRPLQNHLVVPEERIAHHQSRLLHGDASRMRR